MEAQLRGALLIVGWAGRWESEVYRLQAQPSTASLIKSAWFWFRVEAYLAYLVEDPSGSMLEVRLEESEHLQLLSDGE